MENMQVHYDIRLFNEINEVMEKQIRPGLQADGGDVDVVSLEGKRLYLGLKGACSGCPRAYETLKYGIENALKSLVDNEIEVIPVP